MSEENKLYRAKILLKLPNSALKSFYGEKKSRLFAKFYAVD